MINRQIFAKGDSLRLFKQDKQTKFPNCAFYQHDINNQEIDISSGFEGNIPINESIITDGEISLQKKNLYSPSIVWEEHLLTLENGTSISITLDKASFMIAVTKRLGEQQIDIHVTEESRDLLTKILNFFYGKQSGLFQTSSIYFTSPTILILENIINGKKKQQTFDFSTSSTKEYYKQKRHKRRH